MTGRCQSVEARQMPRQCFLHASHEGPCRFVCDLLGDKRTEDDVIAQQLHEISRLRDGIRHALKVMYPIFPIDYNVRVHLRSILDGKDRI